MSADESQARARPPVPPPNPLLGLMMCPQDGHSHDWRDCPTPEGLLDDPVVALAPKSSRVVRGKVMRRGK